jgi:hypothetical protein
MNPQHISCTNFTLARTGHIALGTEMTENDIDVRHADDWLNAGKHFEAGTKYLALADKAAKTVASALLPNGTECCVDGRCG